MRGAGALRCSGDWSVRGIVPGCSIGRFGSQVQGSGIEALISSKSRSI